MTENNSDSNSNNNSYENSQNILDIDDKFDDDEEPSLSTDKKTLPNTTYTPPSQTALPFVIFENGKFIIPEISKKLLSQKTYENIGIISLVGKYRTGKSFLLNRVLLEKKQEKGFDVGPTFKPCTKGIWIWSDPLIITNNHCPKPFPVFLIDTEGLGAYDEEINHDTKIFLIAVLISSLFIFNSVGAIDENAINSLSFVLNLSKTIKIKSIHKEDNEEELAEYFPTLLWLLRDFSLKLEDKNGNVITEKQYLENALEKLNGSSDAIEEKNRVRSLIKTYFQEKDCFVMVRPVENESDLQNLQNLPESVFRKEFVEQAKIFRNKVIKKTKPKMFHKKPLTGAMLVELVQSVLDSINGGTIPVIENSWKYVLQNECIKNSKEAITKFVNEINKYREDNKNKPDFINNVKRYSRRLSQKYLSEFLKNSLLDEDVKKEFESKFESKLNNELNKFDKENEKVFEEKFNEELTKLSNEFINTFQNNNDIYSKNYFQFFQDFENFKEKANALTPDFPHKSEILFDKILLIIKKFIDDLKNKTDKEINSLKLENEKYKIKNTELMSEISANKEKNNNNISKLSNDITTEKIKNKNFEEKIKNLLNSKKLDQDNYQKQLENIKINYENKIQNLSNSKIKLENDLKYNNEELLVLKMNNDKMISLNEQKLMFLEKEINSWKEKYNNLNKDSKNKEEKLNGEISNLKDQIKNFKIEKSKKDNTDQFNTNINNLMNYFKENLKLQNEENKNMFQKMMQQKNSQTENQLLKNYNELLQKHSQLQIESNQKDAELKKIEEENQLNKNIFNNIKALKCLHCSKLFTLEEFKLHYDKCSTNKNNNNNNISKNNIDPENEQNKLQINPENLRIKILKGKLKSDELGKPYLDYVVDVSYNTQNWRINKRFNQFANLYKTIKSIFKGGIRMPPSASIFVNFGNFNGSFHENKIQQLEKFIQDLSEIECVCNSKIFRKFLEFEQYYDEDNDILLFNNNKNYNIKQNNNINKVEEDISNNNFGYNNRYIDNDIIKFGDINKIMDNDFEDFDG